MSDDGYTRHIMDNYTLTPAQEENHYSRLLGACLFTNLPQDTITMPVFEMQSNHHNEPEPIQYGTPEFMELIKKDMKPTDTIWCTECGWHGPERDNSNCPIGKPNFMQEITFSGGDGYFGGIKEQKPSDSKWLDRATYEIWKKCNMPYYDHDDFENHICCCCGECE